MKGLIFKTRWLCSFGVSSGLLIGCGGAQAGTSPPSDATEERSPDSGSSAEEEALAEAIADEGMADDGSRATTASGTSDGCQIEVEVRMEEVGDGTLKGFTILTNKSGKDVKVKWTAPCPGAGVEYEGGLPGYDYGNACAAGICPGTEDHFALDLGPGKQAAVGNFTVAPAGNACNKKIPDGSYSLTPTSEFSGGSVCPVKSASFRVQGKKATVGAAD